MYQDFDSPEFSVKFNYFGRLGAIVKKRITEFSVWAPDARAVFLNLYDKGEGTGSGDISVRMQESAHGVFGYISGRNLHGKYYTYTLVRDNGEEEIVDPYCCSTGINGKRGMVVDFSSPRVTPNGWENDRTVNLKSYCDAIITETHIRDFTSKTEAKEKMKFGGMAEGELKTPAGLSAGFDHLKELGVTHVHLLPVAEYATVDQSKLNEKGYNGYNWGYDPLNYNTPSGVYASDPADGSSKVYGLRSLVKKYHDAGIGVILDVVYNHTYNLKNPLHRLLPGYFYRTDVSGNPTDGSGCGNETASERPMCGKFILDSLEMYAREYHVDGFRFDLMALTDIDTLARAEKMLHEINPSLILYGEGWTGGWSSLPEEKRSDRRNILKIRKTPGTAGTVAVFSDVTRDSIKGPVFHLKEGGYVNGRAYENVLAVKYASMGCTSPNFSMNWVNTNAENCISYVSAHDNCSLFDKICSTVEDHSERAARSRLAGAVVLTSRGVPFFMAGEEFLRIKTDEQGKISENSYNAPDFVNGIDWTRKDSDEGRKTFEYYRQLIKLRKEHPLLRLGDAEETEKATDFIIVEDRYDIIAYTLKDEKEELLIIYNPLVPYDFTLPAGRWKALFGTEGEFEKILHVPEISCQVLKKM